MAWFVHMLQSGFHRGKNRVQSEIHKVHPRHRNHDAAMEHNPGIEHVIENVEQRNFIFAAGLRVEDRLIHPVRSEKSLSVDLCQQIEVPVSEIVVESANFRAQRKRCDSAIIGVAATFVRREKL